MKAPKVPDYRHMPPIGQIDNMSCWAACFAWWLKATGRKPSTQMELITEFDSLTDDDGGLTNDGLRTLASTPRFNMQLAEFDLSRVADIRDTGLLPLVGGPNLIAYSKFLQGPGIVGMHMNVVWNQRPNGDSTIVTCMDPAYPADAGNGQRKGAILDRYPGVPEGCSCVLCLRELMWEGAGTRREFPTRVYRPNLCDPIRPEVSPTLRRSSGPSRRHPELSRRWTFPG